jgi:hypothetical protein
VVGRTEIWRNASGITADPGCRDGSQWQEVE